MHMNHIEYMDKVPICHLSAPISFPICLRHAFASCLASTSIDATSVVSVPGTGVRPTMEAGGVIGPAALMTERAVGLVGTIHADGEFLGTVAIS